MSRQQRKVPASGATLPRSDRLLGRPSTKQRVQKEPQAHLLLRLGRSLSLRAAAPGSFEERLSAVPPPRGAQARFKSRLHSGRWMLADRPRVSGAWWC